MSTDMRQQAILAILNFALNALTLTLAALLPRLASGLARITRAYTTNIESQLAAIRQELSELKSSVSGALEMQSRDDSQNTADVAHIALRGLPDISRDTDSSSESGQKSR